MMWGYVKFPDETQVAYSDIREDGTVLIRIERPADMGFDSAECLMPAYRWGKVNGFTPEEVEAFDTFLHNNAPLIFTFARHPEERLEVA